MTHSHSIFAADLSANDLFKLKYPRYIKGAIIAMLALTSLFVWLWPGVKANPYQLRIKEEMIWVDIPDQLDIPDPQVPVAPPRIMPNIEAAPNDDPEPVEFEWEPQPFWNQGPAAPVDPDSYDGFVSSSALPQLIFQARADYPELARRLRTEGTVMVHVLVNASGQVNQAIVIQEVNPLLDKAALAAARKCRFTPARQRELKVKAWVAIPFRFRLN